MPSKDAAIRSLRLKNQGREKLKSMRTRRRANELFTELKASGKIPKEAKFEDLSEQKFYKASEDIEESEVKRQMIQMYQDSVKRKP